MNLAWISVGALVLAVTLSCTTTINVGILSLALALVVGVFLGGMTPNAVLEGFPTELLVTLIGITLLFAIAECNGTLARLTARAVRLCRGHAGVLVADEVGGAAEVLVDDLAEKHGTQANAPAAARESLREVRSPTFSAL